MNTKTLISKNLKIYLPLIKSLQTMLLLITGITGYISARCPIMSWKTFVGLLVSLFLTISGSTILNMWYDRDIDVKMDRTKNRPLPSGTIDSNEVFKIGLIISTIGVVIALSMSPLYGLIIFAGLFIDVVIYTMWLKRKTAWSIVWGGISGGMPILAGRALGIGEIDFIGVLFSVSILLWIPTHILTFSIKYFEDYNLAGIPTFPSTYGKQKTRVIIAISSFGAAVSIATVAFGLGLSWGYLRLFSVLTFGIIGLAGVSIYKPSEIINFGLFKYASFYMLGAMILVVLGTL